MMKNRQHVAVIDLGFGDSGKGTVVNRLCATGDYDLVVRFNGGAQCGHRVVLDDGTEHVFAQFGSGTLWGIPTYLSDHMLVEPLSLGNEAEGLKKIGVQDPFGLLRISSKCLITTPYHWLVNRARENTLGESRHGSCGRGIGATVEYSLRQPEDALRIKDLIYPNVFLDKMEKLCQWAKAEQGIEPIDHENLYDDYLGILGDVKLGLENNRVLQDCRVVFEGAQGVLLDEHVGFHPHTTWSTCTPENAISLLHEFGQSRADLEVMGVTRTYATRHGQGPFVTEDKNLSLPDLTNGNDGHQGAWRVGHLDLVALDYATEMAGIDSLYVTHCDVAQELPVCVGYKFGSEFDFSLKFALNGWKMDLEERAAVTKTLYEVRPVLVDRDFTWEELALRKTGRSLVGFGYGPRTTDGQWS